MIKKTMTAVTGCLLVLYVGIFIGMMALACFTELTGMPPLKLNVAGHLGGPLSAYIIVVTPFLFSLLYLLFATMPKGNKQ